MSAAVSAAASAAASAALSASASASASAAVSAAVSASDGRDRPTRPDPASRAPPPRAAPRARSRFYLFSRREPEEPEGEEQIGRDVFNEKPSKEDLALAEREAKGPLPRAACINTSYGEIRLRLFPDECASSH